MNLDFTSSGHAELLVSSPWGIAVLSEQGGVFTSVAIAQSGSVLGGWRLDSDQNHIGPVGNFDGSRACSFLVTSGWGIGVIKAAGSGFTSVAGAGNGTALAVQTGINGGANWVVDTATSQYGPTGNFFGDGRDIILVRSQGGFATLRQSGNGFVVGVVIHDGAVLAGAAVSHADRFGPVADFLGNRADQVVLVGAQGVWLLVLGASPDAMMFVANGTSFGGWTLDTSQDQFGFAADFDGDGKAELVISRAGTFALLKLSAAGFTLLDQHQPGDWIGGWHVGAGDRLGPVGYFAGTQRPELLIRSGWGFGVLAWSAGGFAAGTVTQNGTACGNWRSDTGGDRMIMAADFDGDGRAELLVSSGWGAGLLDLSGAAAGSKAVSANGTALGSWRLDTTQNDLAAGSFRTELIIGYNANWNGVVGNTIRVFTDRGSFVTACNDGATWVTAIQTYAATCAPGDRLFVYIGADGGDPRTLGDLTTGPCEQHGWGFDTGNVNLSQVGPSFRAIANRNADLIVLDGGCFGGETVFDAFGQGYCAMSLTGINDVAGQNDPDLGGEVTTETKPATFGMWWNAVHLVGSRLNGRLMLHNAQVFRVQQRLYRNDNTAAMQAMLFGRPSIGMLYWTRSWALDVGGCYLFPLLFPGTAASETGPWTNTIQPYLDNAHHYKSGSAPSLATYRSAIIGAAQVPEVAAIYAARYATVWQCLMDDPAWDVTGQPTKHLTDLNNLNPSAYQGDAGFLTLVNMANGALTTIELCSNQEENLVVSIDAAVRNSATLGGKAPQPTRMAPPSPQHLRDLQLSMISPQGQATLAMHSTAIRKIADRVGHSAQLLIPAAGFPHVDAKARLDQYRASWTAAALTEPTGDATVDQLAAQLIATYSYHETTVFTASLVLSIIEDALIAHQSSGQRVPGDLLLF